MTPELSELADNTPAARVAAREGQQVIERALEALHTDPLKRLPLIFFDAESDLRMGLAGYILGILASMTSLALIYCGLTP